MDGEKVIGCADFSELSLVGLVITSRPVQL